MSVIAANRVSTFEINTPSSTAAAAFRVNQQTVSYGLILSFDFLSSPLPLALSSHMCLHRSPDILYHLSIPPPSRLSRFRWHARTMTSLIPALHHETLDASSPPFDFTRQRLTFFANVHAQHVLKQFLRFSPFVGAELPFLTGGEHGHHT